MALFWRGALFEVRPFFRQGNDQNKVEICLGFTSPKTAVVHGKSSTAWHDTLVSYIQQKGSVYAFHKKYRYGLRAHIEAYFSSLKRCIGRSFKTIKLESQAREAIIMGNIMNLWDSFGRPVCVKTG